MKKLEDWAAKEGADVTIRRTQGGWTATAAWREGAASTGDVRSALASAGTLEKTINALLKNAKEAKPDG